MEENKKNELNDEELDNVNGGLVWRICATGLA